MVLNLYICKLGVRKKPGRLVRGEFGKVSTLESQGGSARELSFADQFRRKASRPSRGDHSALVDILLRKTGMTGRPSQTATMFVPDLYSVSLSLSSV